MALYAADLGAPSVDWTNHPAVAFQCLNDAIKPFRHDVHQVDEVFTLLAFEIYNIGMSLQKPTGPIWQAWTYFLQQPHYLPISEEVRLHLTALDLPLHQLLMPASTTFATAIKDLRQVARSLELFEEETTKLLLEIKDWLLKCACHDSVDTDGSLLREMRAIIVQQPHVDLSKKGNYRLQRSERVTGGFGIWPDLTRTLSALRPSSEEEWSSKDEENAVMAVTSYLSLAANMISCFMFMSAYPEGNLGPVYKHTFECERIHACLIESPFSPFPLKVRQALSESNYLGNSVLISSMVLPNINAGHPHTLFLMFRWVMLAATHPDADPTGNVRSALSKVFDLGCLERLPYLCSRHGVFLRLNIPGDVLAERFLNPDTEQAENNILAGSLDSQDAIKLWNERSHEPKLHPHWNLEFGFGGEVVYVINDPLDDVHIARDFPRAEDLWLEQHMHCIPDPKPDDECLICKDDFTETPCYATACNHLYHLDCLTGWRNSLKNAGSSSQLTCCYCTKELMDEVALARVEIARQKGVPIHLTPAMYEEQMRRFISFGLLFETG
ncbi:hypothetical protein HBI56_162980 [Parastagonospora nodorum]|uniref:RING-type domain-containing protein n=2 Tax=Phaeosphaeria nodorum (strain SN15 / ATCC MYA-4574 / FGSC 10173) TaxID=321614 RepID=A0A7U2NPN5_PHANO|nr:hypothetical protein SNOG_13312 [Parastagonospora nodorum SN15]KAH3911571.1 hypothetical protein HBH56_125260 [Parastagonospora nodorum]EAT79196.1 hypothetical protein SNOG_13312 [Parastagonospora nodorum SN15]KAH3931614.1 hypothetical protein HBH54_098250 [Parastagonospora nodorum]KAH3944412.1 hypothetical protein HBH53_159720 [Parastagonospora nodorum]KAH3956851.1 hypothetical protein HBH51_233570 [Parastagonospora nodorum]